MPTEPLSILMTPAGARHLDADGKLRRFLPRNTGSVLWVLAMTDFRTRYRGQQLGLTWSLLQPIAMMAILAKVLQSVARIDVPHFPFYVLCGIIYWQFCSRIWSAATRTFFVKNDLAKRATFRRYLMPISTVASHCVTGAIECVLVLGVAILMPGSLHFGWSWLVLPVLVSLLVLLLLSLSVLTATLCVFFRDIAFIVETLLAFLYWLTPVFYPPEALPRSMQILVQLSPFSALLISIRTVLMRGEFPDGSLLALDFLFPVLAFVASAMVYRAYESRLADQL